MTFVLFGITFHVCSDEIQQWAMAAPVVGPMFAGMVLKLKSKLGELRS